MKTPQEIVGAWIMYGILALIAAGILWWVGDSILDAIRAPEVRKTQEAVRANEALQKDNNRLEAQNAQLDRLLSKRSTFERGVKRELAAIGKGLAEIKKTNQRVKAWAETEIPPEVLQ